jgi:hypothetical protein
MLVRADFAEGAEQVCYHLINHLAVRQQNPHELITASIILFAIDNAEICSSRGISFGVRSLNIAWQLPQRHHIMRTVLKHLQMAAQLVGYIDVCLVRVARCILPLTSWMRFDLTPKEMPLDVRQTHSYFDADY